tara:strand:+ start:41 stop:457 length:417 start_codon:yes stop_codon:yes gene_type:complete
MLNRVVSPPKKNDPQYPRRQRKRGLSKVFGDPQSLSIDQRDAQGRTALHYAIIGDDREVTRILLDYDADPALDDSFGVSSQQMARTPEMVELLKEAAVARIERVHSRWALERELEHDSDDEDSEFHLPSPEEEDGSEL